MILVILIAYFSLYWSQTKSIISKLTQQICKFLHYWIDIFWHSMLLTVFQQKKIQILFGFGYCSIFYKYVPCQKNPNSCIWQFFWTRVFLTNFLMKISIQLLRCSATNTILFLKVIQFAFSKGLPFMITFFGSNEIYFYLILCLQNTINFGQFSIGCDWLCNRNLLTR